MRAKTVAEVIAGEAVSGTEQERWNDMLAIASVMYNRAQQLGVPIEDVAQVKSEFNAYNSTLPAGADEYTGLAQEAIDYVKANGPVHSATFYATPAATDNLPNGLEPETETTGHQYFSDPLNRSIRTAQGFMSPITEPASNLMRSGYEATTGLLSDAYNTTTDAAKGLAGIVSGGLDFRNPNQAQGMDPTFSGILSDVAEAQGSPLGINSGYRSPSYNASIGGTRGSLHQQGLAADIDMTGMDDNERSMLVDRLTERGVGGLITYSSSPDMLHVDMRAPMDEGPRMMFNKTASLIDQAPDWFKAKAAAQNLPGVYPGLDDVEPAPSLPVDTAPVPALLDRSQPPTGLLASAPVVNASPPDVNVSSWQDMAKANQTSPAVQAISDQMAQPAAMPSYAELTAAKTAPAGVDPAAAYGQYAKSMQQAGLQNLADVPGIQNTVMSPSLETVDVASQPSVSPGITATASVPQVEVPQASAVVPSAPPQQQKAGLLSDLGITKQGLTGGLLGGLTLGPVGGLIGGLLGNYVAKNPGALGNLGLTNMSNYERNYLGSGNAAFQGVYGPGAKAGNTFTANNGATVSLRPDGKYDVVTPSGVHEVHSPDGSVASAW